MGNTLMIERKKLSLIATAILFVLFVLSICNRADAQKVKTTPFGKGINFMAADSSMKMKMNVRMQNLVEVVNIPELEDHTSVNFLVRRYRLKFAGFVYDPRLRYKMELGISNRDQGNKANHDYNNESSNIILDAVVKYKFNPHWDLWFGQTKLPGNRERVVSSADLQMVDRSLVNSYYNIDRDKGVWLYGEYTLGNQVIRPKASISTGEGRNITVANLGGLDYTGRIEWMPLGKFEGKKEDYVQSILTRQSKPKLAIGVTYDYNDRAVRQQGQLKSFVEETLVDENGDAILDGDGEEQVSLAQNTLTTLFVDFVFKYRGLSILGEYADKKGEKETQDNWSKGYRTGAGYSGQAGYLFKSNYEISGRYSKIWSDHEASGVGQGKKQYTLGLSKYIVGHKLKIQTDFSLFQYDIYKGSKRDDDYMARLQVELQI